MPNPFTFLSTMRGKPRRGMLRRAVFSDAQRKGLEKMFQRQKYISKPDRKKLASKLGLKDSQVGEMVTIVCVVCEVTGRLPRLLFVKAPIRSIRRSRTIGQDII